MSDVTRGALPPKLYFRIGEVAGLVGVEPHVLRYWEREFRSIRPTKSAKGQRVYSRRDVENLMRVRELLYAQGFTIAGAKKRLREKGVEPEETEDVTLRMNARMREQLVALKNRGRDFPGRARPMNARRPRSPRAIAAARGVGVALWAGLGVGLGAGCVGADPAHAMPAERVEIHLAPPPGWGPAALAEPDLSQSPEVALLGWKVWGPSGSPGGAPARDTRLVAACFGVETSRWTKEAEPIVLDKVAQMAASTALRVGGLGAMRPVETKDAPQGGAATQELEGTGDATESVSARTFLGFVPPTMVGCFALCVDPHGQACRTSALEARVDGHFRPPPEPGVLLDGVLAAVHHPRAAASTLAALAALGGVLAIVTRRRPRH